MQSTSLTRNSFCFYQFHFQQYLTIPSSSSPPSKAHFTKTSFFTLCNKNLVLNIKHRANKNRTFFKPHYTFLQELLYDSNPLHENIKSLGIINRAVILINMWWAGLKANLGQRINMEAIVCSATVFTKAQHLAMPHVTVPDIRYIDWAELSRIGFKGVVFDKDNTITAPYSLSLWGPLRSSLDECKSVFGDDIAIFSNSSGLCEYDPDYSKARTLENAIGIKVLRHRVKKPAGTAEEIEEHFGCESSKLIMVGDRPFTDIVFGNRNGFLTILTEPLTLAREPFIVKQVRKLESFLLGRWFKKGLRPTSHTLLPDVQQCVKEPPSL